ncbi:hypothetical protein BDV32DRAFT_151235 [Aspergillus pseudonomiae]|nr:hypothetical protein BDV32DRAFT_151235 [Aspergillus pseudonomiae]
MSDTGTATTGSFTIVISLTLSENHEALFYYPPRHHYLRRFRIGDPSVCPLTRRRLDPNPVKGVPEPEKRDDGAIRIPVKGVPEPEKRDDGAIRIPVKGVPAPPAEE